MSEGVSRIREQLEEIIGMDRKQGSRGAEFEPGGPAAGTPTKIPTKSNLEIIESQTASQKPPSKRSLKDIISGRG